VKLDICDLNYLWSDFGNSVEDYGW